MLLRFLALSLILSLLFESIFRWIQRQSQKPTFALLIDTSKSTGLHPNSVKDALNKLKLPDLNAKIQVYTFDSDTKAAPNNAYDNLKFNGDRTDMVKALNRVREDLGSQNLGGVMVISDGQYNTGRNPSFLAERFPVPIHTIAVGDTTKQRDVQVRRAVTNEVAYINTELPGSVGIRAHGFDRPTSQCHAFGWRQNHCLNLGTLGWLKRDNCQLAFSSNADRTSQIDGDRQPIERRIDVFK